MSCKDANGKDTGPDLLNMAGVYNNGNSQGAETQLPPYIPSSWPSP